MPVSSQLLGICGRSPGAPRRMARQLACGTPAVPLRPLASRRLRSGALKDGHAAAHSAVHLRLFVADALGGLGQGAPAEARADCAKRAANGAGPRQANSLAPGGAGPEERS